MTGEKKVGGYKMWANDSEKEVWVRKGTGGKHQLFCNSAILFRPPQPLSHDPQLLHDKRVIESLTSRQPNNGAYGAGRCSDLPQSTDIFGDPQDTTPVQRLLLLAISRTVPYSLCFCWTLETNNNNIYSTLPTW